jgi:hypothetical protein
MEHSDSAVPGIPSRLLDLWAGIQEDARDGLSGLQELLEETATVAAYLPAEQPAQSTAAIVQSWFEENSATLAAASVNEVARLRSIVIEAADFADAAAVAEEYPGGETNVDFNIACTREALYILIDFLDYRGSSCL